MDRRHRRRVSTRSSPGWAVNAKVVIFIGTEQGQQDLGFCRVRVTAIFVPDREGAPEPTVASGGILARTEEVQLDTTQAYRAHSKRHGSGRRGLFENKLSQALSEACVDLQDYVHPTANAADLVLAVSEDVLHSTSQVWAKLKPLVHSFCSTSSPQSTFLSVVLILR